MTYIVRFHVREGQETLAAVALREVVPQSRAEDGCLGINALRSIRDPQVFFIYSRWKDEAAFERHAEFAHTRRFVGVMEKLIDHPWDGTRLEEIA